MKQTLAFSSFSFFFLFSLLGAVRVEAATLSLYPNTGVYTVGNVFTVSVRMNTEGKAVNAADGQLSFNPKELQVVTASRSNSIFNLWTEEPTYSNTQGTLSFGGGSPSGYSGSSGSVVTVTMRTLTAGTPKITWESGSVLAADGLGTNVLNNMGGGTYIVTAASETPSPEYVAPAHTPEAPRVRSASHPDSDGWYRETIAKLSWELPGQITAIRTLLDSSPETIPTIVYDEPITEKTIEELPEGISYFHIQFRNSNGWGKVAHYRLAVDTEPPQNFTVREVNGWDNKPGNELEFSFDDVSPVTRYGIQVDGVAQSEYKDDEETRRYLVGPLSPGRHSVVVEAFDSAGNSAIANYALEVATFEKPRFIEYPERIHTEVIPAIVGETRPGARVSVEVRRQSDGIHIGGNADDPFSIVADENGRFVFIPDSTFERGVYTITAQAIDRDGMQSEVSDAIQLIVEAPGYIVLGTLAMNILSLIIPLTALMILLTFGTWYLWHRLSVWRHRVRKEALEAEQSLATEFTTIVKNLNSTVASLKKSRKGKLTQAEIELIAQLEKDLKNAQEKVGKEIEDIEKAIK